MNRRDLFKAATGLALAPDPVTSSVPVTNNFIAQAEAAARIQYHLRITGQGPIFTARQQADFFFAVH